jgi:hypothetical protein
MLDPCLFHAGLAVAAGEGGFQGEVVVAFERLGEAVPEYGEVGALAPEQAASASITEAMANLIAACWPPDR